MLQRPERLYSPGEETAWKTSGSAMGRHYIRILDPDGMPLIESEDMASLLPRDIFPPVAAGASPMEATREWTSRQGKPYVLLSERLQGGRHAGRPSLVQAALETSHERALLRDYRRKMGLTLLFGILTSAGAGAWVARRGLRPLAEITETAQSAALRKAEEAPAARGPAARGRDAGGCPRRHERRRGAIVSAFGGSRCVRSQP
jgi:hypothetical protein